MAEWTKEREEGLRALCAAAASGPWGFQLIVGATMSLVGNEESVVAGIPNINESREQDGEFIAEARAGLPDALAEIDRLRAENVRLRHDLARKDCQEFDGTLHCSSEHPCAACKALHELGRVTKATRLREEQGLSLAYPYCPFCGRHIMRTAHAPNCAILAHPVEVIP